MRFQFSALLAAAWLACSAVVVHAHEGHDHGSPPPMIESVAAPRAEAQSDAFELVVVAREGGLVFTLDRFRDNEPVTDAVLEVDTPEGARTARPEGGVYRLDAPWAQRPGSYDLMVTVTQAAFADVLTLTLNIPDVASPVQEGSLAKGARASGLLAVALAGGGFLGGFAAAAFLRRRRRVATLAATLILAAAVSQAMAQSAPQPASRDVARRMPDGAVFMPKQTQRLLEIRTTTLAEGAHAVGVALPGRVIADPNASGYVQAAVSGRLSPPEGGFPRLGARVAKGDLMAYVTPPLSAAETSDQRQRQGELDQQILLLRQRIARFEKLVDSGAVARVQLEEARIEHEALKDRRRALDQMRRAPERLVAPVSGVVAAANAVAGQIADANAIVFQIVDPRRLWVEALSPQALDDIEGAQARTSEDRTFPLIFKGAGLADKTQFLPVHFALPADADGLRVGQFVSVYVRKGEAVQGIVAPRTAVVAQTNGQHIVFEHARAERFEARDVRIAPLDADRVLILAGVAPGRRIVVQGAELMHQVR